MTIQDFMKKHLPEQFKSGQWGCHIIEPIGEGREDRLKAQYPHGFKVKVTKHAYWVWLSHD